MRLFAASSPHIRHGDDIRVTMGDTILPLLFLLFMAVYYTGWRALTLTAVSVVSAVVFEYLYRRILRKSRSIGDISAIVTGMIIAFCMPVSAPIWFPIVGSFFAIVVVKQLFGGLGGNIFNPAASAICLLTVTWPGVMSTFPQASEKFPLFATPVNFETGVPVLTSLKNGTLPDNKIFEMLIGYTPSNLGTGAILIIAIAALVLLYRRIISWKVPLAFLGTVALAAFIFPRCPSGRIDSVLFELTSGSVAFAAVFMATDPVTSPVTTFGRLLYGFFLGVITIFIRYFGIYPEGAFFAILIMNPFVLALDRLGWTFKMKGGRITYEQQ
ncbi:MAG TPA: RnfABCDGE type electron transport complex subunit D [Ruminiclostridium sp.]|nr:RnfABCDGE type electron transport complex subunit D [Ruminiclostridium sp.]